MEKCWIRVVLSGGSFEDLGLHCVLSLPYYYKLAKWWNNNKAKATTSKSFSNIWSIYSPPITQRSRRWSSPVNLSFGFWRLPFIFFHIIFYTICKNHLNMQMCGGFYILFFSFSGFLSFRCNDRVRNIWCLWSSARVFEYSRVMKSWGFKDSWVGFMNVTIRKGLSRSCSVWLPGKCMQATRKKRRKFLERQSMSRKLSCSSCRPKKNCHQIFLWPWEMPEQ